MKKRVFAGLFFAAAVLYATTGYADGASAENEPIFVGNEGVTAEMKPVSDVSAAETVTESSNLDHIGRGVTNLLTCYMEVPRCMLYQNSKVPLWGMIYGTLEGVCLTPLRAFGGVTDVVFLGYDPGLIYDNAALPDYVWESDWVCVDDGKKLPLN